jgi:hypothetical protein
MKNEGAVALPNIGYLKKNVPDELFNNLKKECLEWRESEDVMTTGLSSMGVTKHFWIKDNKKVLQDYVLSLVKEYNESFDYIRYVDILSKNLPFTAGDPWFNIQKKGQFIPNHVHQGVYSYTIWVKIPYGLEKEYGRMGEMATTYSGQFEFTYPTTLGSLWSQRFDLTKEYEGVIILFPSKLLHCVYPFCSTDEERISISGNIFLDADRP